MKTLLKLLLFLIILVLMVLYFIYRHCPENRRNDSIDKNDYILIDNVSEIEQLDYALLDNETIFYRYGLYPGHQGCRDVGYQYSGNILINGEKYKIGLKNRMPAFIGLYKNEIYLLARGYIHNNQYYWYKFNNENNLLYLDFNSIPDAFYYVKFENKKINYLYIVSVLEELLDKDFELSLRLLKIYVEDGQYFDLSREEGISGIEGYLMGAIRYVANSRQREDLFQVIDHILNKYPDSEAARGIRNYKKELLLENVQ